MKNKQVSGRFKWQWMALKIMVMGSALMLAGDLLVKNNVHSHPPASFAFGAGDVVLFVVMPVLNTVLK